MGKKAIITVQLVPETKVTKNEIIESQIMKENYSHSCDRSREMIRTYDSSTVREESTLKGKARYCWKRVEREQTENKGE